MNPKNFESASALALLLLLACHHATTTTTAVLFGIMSVAWLVVAIVRALRDD